MKRMILATGNPGKAREFASLLAPLAIPVSPMTEAGYTGPIEETGATFEENARLKAQAVFQATGWPSLADDSGLEVDALAGAPGIYTARYGGEGFTDAERTQLLLEALSDVPAGRRTARFVCVLCCVLEGGRLLSVRGECAGEIALTPKGTGGFGYDPVFLLPDGRTMAELSAAEKGRYSHRARAVEALLPLLRPLIGR